MFTVDFAIGIGGEAGQGIATSGNIFARTYARRGLHLNAYNDCQATSRGYQWGGEIPTGLFWKRTDRPSFEALEPVLHAGGPLAGRPLGIHGAQAQDIIRELL